MDISADMLQGVYEAKLASAQAYLHQLLVLQRLLVQQVAAAEDEVRLCQHEVDACNGVLLPKDYIV